MFDNDFETAINFYFFLKETEYVFSQFVTTVGKTDPDTGELFLEDNPAFRNYKKKSRKAIDNHTNAPHLTQKTKNFYLDKCRYYLYPEKRKPYKLKNGEGVDSESAFSNRCVTMFFSLTGIDFSFLRIKLKRKESIVTCQKKCLEDLFSSVLTFFMETNCVPFGCPQLHNSIHIDDFKKWVRFLYVRYRRLLIQENVELFKTFLPLEAKKIIECEKKTSIELCHVVYRPDVQYNLYRNEVDKKNESLMQRMNAVLYNIETGIRTIHNARTLKDIEENLKYLFRTKAQTFEKASKKEKKRDWKEEYIRRLICYHTSDQTDWTRLKFYEEGMVRSIVYHSANTCKERTDLNHIWCEISECEQEKECRYRLNCEELSKAKIRLFTLRELLWDYIGDKLPNHLSNELREFTETIEWICIAYFL